MPKFWVTTDTHFGHAKIKIYCGRPLGFENQILKNFVDRVKPVDTVIHLGDVCWGNEKHWHEKFMRALPPCNKWLLKGNHDKRTYSWYLTQGWNFVGETIKIRMYGFEILLSHKPQPPGEYDINIHGHLHNNTGHHPECELTDKHRTVFIEHHYMPMDLKKLVRRYQ